MAELFGKSVSFYKMQGCGNDFVVIDNRELGVGVDAMAEWARKVCARAFGVGADGLFFLENAPEGSGLDFAWQFYNGDGSRAEMCGNASRCAARLAAGLGMAGTTLSFGTDAGPIRAEVYDDGRVKVQLTKPQGLALNIQLAADPEPFEVHFVNTGVPHAVVPVKDVADVDVVTVGAFIRFHDHFKPAGTNVNFVQVKDAGNLLVRTYERGVEAETYACGTGVSAAQVVMNALGLTGPEAKCVTSGGEELVVTLDGDGQVFLTGAAELTYKGAFYPEAIGLSI